MTVSLFWSSGGVANLLSYIHSISDTPCCVVEAKSTQMRSMRTPLLQIILYLYYSKVSIKDFKNYNRRSMVCVKQNHSWRSENSLCYWRDFWVDCNISSWIRKSPKSVCNQSVRQQFNWSRVTMSFNCWPIYQMLTFKLAITFLLGLC